MSEITGNNDNEEIPYDKTMAFLYDEQAEDIQTAMFKLRKHIHYNKIEKCLCGCDRSIDELEKEYLELEKAYIECIKLAQASPGTTNPITDVLNDMAVEVTDVRREVLKKFVWKISNGKEQW